MAMVRTQIYLPHNLKIHVENYAKKQGVKHVDIIRKAIEEFFVKRKVALSLEDVIKQTSGILKHRRDIKSGLEYERRLRNESEKRLKFD